MATAEMFTVGGRTDYFSLRCIGR